MTFYHQYGKCSGEDYEREFIDSRLHPGCQRLETVAAATWLEAADKVAPHRERPGRRK